jgi:hypothetical protein
MPINPDPEQAGNTVDYFYATDATRDGIWSGTWGILRSYGAPRQDLYQLPDNSMQGSRQIVNVEDFAGVCPAQVVGRGRNRRTEIVNLVEFDVAAVLANDVLPNALNVNIPQLTDIDPQFPTTTFGEQTVGGPLNPDGGTLVYNRRGTGLTACNGNIDEEGVCQGTTRDVEGPLNDPTAMMYVRLDDLEPRLIAGVSIDQIGNVEIGVNGDGEPIFEIGPDGIDDRCQEPIGSADPADPPFDLNLGLPGCPVQLAVGAPVEPLALRAEAGACLEVTLHNKLIDQQADRSGHGQ